MVSVPPATPVTTPVLLPIVAIPDVEEAHVPPDAPPLAVSEQEDPAHTDVQPEMEPAVIPAATVITFQARKVPHVDVAE